MTHTGPVPCTGYVRTVPSTSDAGLVRLVRRSAPRPRPHRRPALTGRVGDKTDQPSGRPGALAADRRLAATERVPLTTLPTDRPPWPLVHIIGTRRSAAS
ncbi:hypothetical protein GCM10010345_66980 [Streptomyces canarius]|uniref:Uncharacterized protein n=1 Tax=Streptomyces canarius TaxID=285453 RepID=A0ABQ3D0V4_9ACTN|nr:hypothetical protein GCM10010345_66980 [Streptomyces canarius]